MTAADPLAWGQGPKALEVFLEPTCPHSAHAFGKLDASLLVVADMNSADDLDTWMTKLGLS